ncbi:MAG: UvrD-helicase domain-containing protein [Spirochaetales bacterium]|nr:UvrD-helicase domain-containing protein [Spirochaetales bacterium]
MVIDIKNELNPMQYEAAATVEGPVLIIAGAGSGKTRMITFRIAHMILNHKIPQASILALTFTNKAAKEMAERVVELTKKKMTNLTVSTFHSFGVQVLKKTIHHLGYKSNFTIYDENDKISAIKEAARELEIPYEALNLFELSKTFSDVKTLRRDFDPNEKHFRVLYEKYNECLKAYNAVDFDDLIILPIEIFNTFPDILEEYRERFRYIMVDEFQDTSLIQYEMVRLLGMKYKNVCVVGDDDQSIYSWRGANYQNIVNFESDFPLLKEIKLEQNYRSTKEILTAANHVIANNTNRKEKQLWSGNDGERSIEIFYPDNEADEAEFIAELINTLKLKENIKYDEVGILVRTNNLSSVIEEALLSGNIPYRVSGGSSFFQRKEIKDIIAYLKLIVNPKDDISFLRIINTPRRGVGLKNLGKIRHYSDSFHCSLFEAMQQMTSNTSYVMPDNLRSCLSEFCELILEYKEKFETNKNLAAHTLDFIETINYWGYLIIDNQSNDKLVRWKYGNVKRFVEFLRRWESNPDNPNPNLGGYLTRITLISSDEDDPDDILGKVNLMTIHASKGLEFDRVFLAGVEDKIIPHERSIEENPENIEEERRLFYVAITRARQKLYITSCRTRKSMRETLQSKPSRFLAEIPKNLINNHVPDTAISEDDVSRAFASLKDLFKKEKT